MADKSENYKLSDEDVKNLIGNTLQMGGYWGSITFSETQDDADTVKISENMSAGELRQAVVNKIGTCSTHSTNKYKVIDYDLTTGSVTIEFQNNSASSIYVREQTSSSGGYYENHPTNQTATALNIHVEHTGIASLEGVDAYKITLPELPDSHFAVKIGGEQYLFYDSSKFDNGYSFDSSETSPYFNSSHRFDIKSWTSPEQIYSKITSLIDSKFSGLIEQTNNVITVTATAANTPLDASISEISGVSATIVTQKYIPGTGSTQQVLGVPRTNYQQNYSLQMNLSEKMPGTDPSGLYGTGFAFAASYNGNNYTWYEFSDGNNQTSGASSTRTGAKQVDISGCNTYSEVAAALQTALQTTMGSDVTVSADASGILTITGSRSASSNYPSFSEDIAELDGLFTDDLAAGQLSGIQTVYTANGIDAGQPTAKIDFSGYNSSNFNELHGKGFRVTCATCSGEYVNVVFCYDKGQLDFPKSFDEEDKDSGEMRTIHNLVVELKDMTDGSNIVQAIVDQLTPELDHYTGVAIGNPSSVLNVFDKRQGDIKDDNGNLVRAEVLSGVRTNFIYTTREQFVPYVDDRLGDIDITYIGAEVYVGSEPEPQFIDIHLPYLTLENLKLNPPEPDLSTTESATETLKHAKAANNVISFVRGTLGADCNRLEHAYADLAQAEEQAADAFSRIRDTDMAELMMEQTKLSILMQAQQAAQTHTMQQPQSVLKLMQ